MDAKQIAEAMDLHQTEARLQRVGLIVERATLSAAHRRVLTALDCLLASHASQPVPVREPLGFAYPTAR